MKPFKHILFIVQIFFYLACLAQKEMIDSLETVLPVLKDSARIDCLNSLSFAHVYHRPDTAKIFAEKALKEAETINYKKGQAVAWFNLAWSTRFLGDEIRTMEIFCKNAIISLDKTDEKIQLAHSWFSLGCALNSQCKFSSSIQAFDKACRLYSQAGDELNLARTYAYMADVERNRGQYNKSLEYAEKWLTIAKKYNDKSYLDVWASLYSIIGDYETALDYYSQAAGIAKLSRKLDGELVFFISMKGEIFLLQEKYDSAIFYFHLATRYMPQSPPLNLQWGTLYLGWKKYDSARLYLNRALIHSKKIDDLVMLQLVLLKLSKLHKETGDIRMALKFARALLQTGQQTGARQHARDGHFMLYQLHVQSGNNDSAFRHLQKYTILRDSIDLDLSAQKLAFYKIKSEKEKDQARIDLLNEEKKLQQQQLKQTAQQRKFLIGGIAGILLLSVILLRNVRLKRKNESNRREIAENELQLQKLEIEKTKAELQHQATELEMQALRAQMNPHFIFNSLNSINLFILQNNKVQASEYLTKFSKLVRMILQNSQQSLISLESELEALKLYLDLEALRFENHFVYKISVAKDMDVEALKLPPLIIQPYTENAIWHGLMHKEEKGHLSIEVYQDDEIVCCRIRDDGIGRERSAKLKNKCSTTHKSVGMQITASRIEMLTQGKQINTHIHITDLVLPNGDSAGTEVLLQIPVIYD